jgi:hypothetical protein
MVFGATHGSHGGRSVSIMKSASGVGAYGKESYPIEKEDVPQAQF